MPRRSIASASLLALLGGCHWIFEHQPHQAGLEAGAPAADLVRPRREHRPAPEASLHDAAAALDLALPSLDSTTGPAILFSDDFSQPGGLIDDEVGTWSVADGVYRQTICRRVPESAVPGKSWGDIVARVRVRADKLCTDLLFPPVNEAGLVVRVDSYKPPGCTNNRYYYCVLDFYSHELYVGERKGTCDFKDKPFQLPALAVNTWYELELAAKGNQLLCRARVNGTWLSGIWTDTSTSSIALGSAGVIADEIRVSFDDFEVLGP